MPSPVISLIAAEIAISISGQFIFSIFFIEPSAIFFRQLSFRQPMPMARYESYFSLLTLPFIFAAPLSGFLRHLTSVFSHAISIYARCRRFIYFSAFSFHYAYFRFADICMHYHYYRRYFFGFFARHAFEFSDFIFHYISILIRLFQPPLALRRYFEYFPLMLASFHAITLDAIFHLRQLHDFRR